MPIARPFRRTLEIDRANETVPILISGDLDAAVARIEQIDMHLGYTAQKRFRIPESEPLSAQAEIVQRAAVRQRDWAIGLEINTPVCDSRLLSVLGRSQAYDGDPLFGQRSWQISIPRHLV